MDNSMPADNKDMNNESPLNITRRVEVVEVPVEASSSDNHDTQELKTDMPPKKINDVNLRNRRGFKNHDERAHPQRHPKGSVTAPINFSHYVPPPQYPYDYFYTGGNGGGGYGISPDSLAYQQSMQYGYGPGYPVMPAQPWPMYNDSAVALPWATPPLHAWVGAKDSSVIEDHVDGANEDEGNTTTTIHRPGPPIQMVPDGHGPEGCNLFIFHIPNEMTNLDLFNFFSPFGNVISARIMVDNENGRSRGFGFVSFDSPRSATDAIVHMNGLQVGNKRLKVQHKKDKGTSGSPGYGPGKGKGDHVKSNLRRNSQDEILRQKDEVDGDECHSESVEEVSGAMERCSIEPSSKVQVEKST
jgi:hypothetical protein